MFTIVFTDDIFSGQFISDAILTGWQYYALGQNLVISCCHVSGL
jgi:hypothetical protein